MQRIIRCIRPALLLLIASTTAYGQPVPTKLPDSVHIFPAGARRGSTVDVHVGLEQAPPNTEFFIRGNGVTGDSVLSTEVFDRGNPSPRRAPNEVPINYPRQWKAQVTVAADAPVGTAYWNTFCASGGSTGSLPFIVGNLPELIESEPNSDLSHAQTTELPMTVNGQIHGERDLDYYKFHLDAGDVVYCDIYARRLGSKLEPTVSIVDSSGQSLPIQEDMLGDDPLIAFKATESGDYYLQIGNVSYHGTPSHVYRATITKNPVITYAYPIGATAGETTKISFYAMDGTGQLLELVRDVTIPDAVSGTYQYPDEMFANDVPLRITPSGQKQITTSLHRQHPEIPIKLGQTANGQLPPFGKDTFALEVTEAGFIELSVIAPSMTSATGLVIMSVTDPDGKVVGRNSIASSADDRQAHDFISTKPGTYVVEIKSVGGINSEHRVSGYQFDVRKPIVEFELAAGADCLSVTQGDALEIPIKLTRLGGFKGPVTITVDGLPENIAIEGNTIEDGKNDTKLKLTVDGTVASRRYELRLNGKAMLGEQETMRAVSFTHRGTDSTGRAVFSPRRDALDITIRHKPVFRLYCEEAYQYAHRGTVYPYLMTIERIDDYDQPITVQQADRQNRDLDGIEFIETTLGKDELDFMMPIYLPETMHINIQSQSQLYTQAYTSFKDATGKQQYFSAVAEKRNMIRTMPTVVKLYARTAELKAQPGELVVAQFELERTSNMRNTMRMQLIDSQISELDVPAVNFQAGQVQLEVPIAVPSDLKPGTYKIRFQASGALDAKPTHTAITSADVTIIVE